MNNKNLRSLCLLSLYSFLVIPGVTKNKHTHTYYQTRKIMNIIMQYLWVTYCVMNNHTTDHGTQKNLKKNINSSINIIVDWLVGFSPTLWEARNTPVQCSRFSEFHVSHSVKFRLFFVWVIQKNYSWSFLKTLIIMNWYFTISHS